MLHLGRGAHAQTQLVRITTPLGVHVHDAAVSEYYGGPKKIMTFLDRIRDLQIISYLNCAHH